MLIQNALVEGMRSCSSSQMDSLPISDVIKIAVLSIKILSVYSYGSNGIGLRGLKETNLSEAVYNNDLCSVAFYIGQIYILIF